MPYLVSVLTLAYSLDFHRPVSPGAGSVIIKAYRPQHRQPVDVEIGHLELLVELAESTEPRFGQRALPIQGRGVTKKHPAAEGAAVTSLTLAFERVRTRLRRRRFR